MTIEEKLAENGYENVTIFKNYDYDSAFVGVSSDNRAIYDYDLMVQYLIDKENMSEIDAIEWIDYNTIRSLSYYGSDAPIILYRLQGD